MAIVVAIIGALGAGGVGIYERCCTGPGPVDASIETSDSVVHGEDNDVTVSAEGLDARTLWVVVAPEVGEGYYMIQNSPLLVADGKTTFTDPQVGDETDMGHYVSYLAYAADQECAAFLAKVDGVTPSIPDSCGESVARADVDIT